MKTESNIINIGESFSKNFNFVSAGCAYNTGTRGIPFLTCAYNTGTRGIPFLTCAYNTGTRGISFLTYLQCCKCRWA